MAVSCFDRLQQLGDSLPLIAARFEVGFKLKWHSVILAQHRRQRRAFRNRISEIAKIGEDKRFNPCPLNPRQSDYRLATFCLWIWSLILLSFSTSSVNIRSS